MGPPLGRPSTVPSIAVCGKVKRYQGADVTLRWQWVAAGRYDAVPHEPLAPPAVCAATGTYICYCNCDAA